MINKQTNTKTHFLKNPSKPQVNIVKLEFISLKNWRSQVFPFTANFSDSTLIIIIIIFWV